MFTTMRAHSFWNPAKTKKKRKLRGISPRESRYNVIVCFPLQIVSYFRLRKSLMPFISVTYSKPASTSLQASVSVLATFAWNSSCMHAPRTEHPILYQNSAFLCIHEGSLLQISSSFLALKRGPTETNPESTECSCGLARAGERVISQVQDGRC